MNREIKFRVWDKLEKHFIYPDKGYQGHYVLTLGGEFYNLQNGSGGNEYIVQQYTGIPDINGREIYEGDIVIWPKSIKDDDIPNPYSGPDRSQFIYNTRQSPKVVTWTHYMKFALEDIPIDGSMTYSFNRNCEVIGNVFENPELL